SDYEKQIMSITGGRGGDLIVEMLANVNLAKDLTMLAPAGGRVVVVGNRGTIEVDPRQTMSREAFVPGFALFAATERCRLQMHAAIVAGLENGSLSHVVGQEIPLHEAAQAHQALMEPGAYGKIVLVP